VGDEFPAYASPHPAGRDHEDFFRQPWETLIAPLLPWSHGCPLPAIRTRQPEKDDVSDLLFWFLVSQTLAGLPQMQPGTVVQLVSHDLRTVFGSATVTDGLLRFTTPISPSQELRLLVFPPDASAQERAQALAGPQALPGRVSEDGQDILVEFPELDGPLSLRKWLAEERQIVLVMPVSDENRRAP
jgi:hypothetical protein